LQESGLADISYLKNSINKMVDFNNILDKIGGYVQSGLSYIGINVSQSTGGLIGIGVIILIIFLMFPERKKN
jgi:hypothetical protein